jgi:hypothetical protein
MPMRSLTADRIGCWQPRGQISDKLEGAGKSDLLKLLPCGPLERSRPETIVKQSNRKLSSTFCKPGPVKNYALGLRKAPFIPIHRSVTLPRIAMSTTLRFEILSEKVLKMSLRGLDLAGPQQTCQQMLTLRNCLLQPRKP